MGSFLNDIKQGFVVANVTSAFNTYVGINGLSQYAFDSMQGRTKKQEKILEKLYATVVSDADRLALFRMHGVSTHQLDKIFHALMFAGANVTIHNKFVPAIALLLHRTLSMLLFYWNGEDFAGQIDGVAHTNEDVAAAIVEFVRVKGEID